MVALKLLPEGTQAEEEVTVLLFLPSHLTDQLVVLLRVKNIEASHAKISLDPSKVTIEGARQGSVEYLDNSLVLEDHGPEEVPADIIPNLISDIIVAHFAVRHYLNDVKYEALDFFGFLAEVGKLD